MVAVIKLEGNDYQATDVAFSASPSKKTFGAFTHNTFRVYMTSNVFLINAEVNIRNFF